MKRSTKRKLIRNGTYVVTHANPRKGEARAKRRRNPLKSAIPGLPAWTMYAGGTAAAEGKHAYSFTAPDGRRYSISPFTTRYGRHAGYILTVFPSRTGGHGWIKSDGSENANGVGTHRSPQAAVSAARLHYGGGESARPNGGRSVRTNGRRRNGSAVPPLSAWRRSEWECSTTLPDGRELTLTNFGTAGSPAWVPTVTFPKDAGTWGDRKHVAVAYKSLTGPALTGMPWGSLRSGYTHYKHPTQGKARDLLVRALGGK